MAGDDRGTAQVRWLIAGRFGLPRGRSMRVERADFNEVLERAGIEVRAIVPDRVGAAGTREIAFKVTSLKDFSLKNVLGIAPELGALLAQAEQLSKLKDPSLDEVRGIVGEGLLFDRLKTLIEPPAETAAPKPSAPASGDVDAIFAKADVAPQTTQKSAKSAIDMFMKSAGGASVKKAKPSARALRDAIEEAAYGAAADVLNSPEVQAIESAWRGLRLFVSECPKDAMMEVRILETDPEHLLEDLARQQADDDIDAPDCIFVPHDFPSVERLSEIAEYAEQELAPIVVGVAPAVFGTEDPQSVPEVFEALERSRSEELPEWAQRWGELAQKEPTRWLCAVLNRVVLHSEGAGSAQRTSFGSGVWAIGPMLAASYRASGGFARIFGKPGALRAPATHTIERGGYKDTAAPTEAFYAIQPAELLSKYGILGLSAARNSDSINLVKAPMVRGAKDAVPLPAQILTGRVVRFASWVKPQLPEGCDSKTADEIFASAAGLLLFPGLDKSAQVRAAVTNIEGDAHVVVRAQAHPSLAGVPFEIVFPLPLGWSVPAPESSDGSDAPATTATADKPAPAAAPQGGVGFAGGSVGFDAGLTKKGE